MERVGTALISVSDKTGLVEFAQGLHQLEIRLMSTGGTARALQDADIPVTLVEEVTGFPEMLEGRVKTLHPAVHGGILADRSKPDHLDQIQMRGIDRIDLVVVNLYPFEQTVANPDCLMADAIENIDIGGPSMIRSAAKNHAGVVVVTSPDDYNRVLHELRSHAGTVRAGMRRELALKAFAATAAYDAAISSYLAENLGDGLDAGALPETLLVGLPKLADLRYGENPHQRAAFYADRAQTEPCVSSAKQINGKPLSYTNILDLNAALELVKEFDQPAAAIIKHTNPCGCAVADTLAEAYCLAREGELPPFNPPGSRFGGIIALNREVDARTAAEIIQLKSFFEGIIAPAFSAEARTMISQRKIWGETVRLLETGPLPTVAALSGSVSGLARLDFRRVVGGVLVQERDLREQIESELEIVTERAPSKQEMADLLFAWKVVRHVKSNAVALAKNGQLIGSGAGQMNRAESSALAVKMAGPRSQGAVVASDAFFPMPDGPEELARAGVTAIIQPGGAKRDADTIAVCNEHHVTMVFTGARHFRH